MSLRSPEGIHGADVTMAQLVECVPNFSEGRNKEVDKLIIFYLFCKQDDLFVFFARYRMKKVFLIYIDKLLF